MHHACVAPTRRPSPHGETSNRRSWIIQYIGPPAESQQFVDAARDEGLAVEYSPLMSARRGNEVFELGEVTLTGPDLRERTAHAMNRVLQQFPIGHMGFSAEDPDHPKDSRQHEVDLRAYLAEWPHSARLILNVSDGSDDTGSA